MKKNGRFRGKQGYRCTSCGKQFVSKDRPLRLRSALWRQYVWQKQTLEQLSKRCGRSKRWVQKQLDLAPLKLQPVQPQAVTAALDTTFWGRNYGVLVVRCPGLRKNLYWKDVTAETPEGYREARRALERQGFAIQAAVIDGKRGVCGIFADIPVQLCQFHQIQTVTRYVTRKPKLQAGKELRAIALALPTLTEKYFNALLSEWHKKWELFLKEKTTPEDGGRSPYTHGRIRSAYRSLVTNSPHLFTYQKYPELKIPNTTNSIDGYFAHLKKLLGVHNGLSVKRRYKLIQEILGR